MFVCAFDENNETATSSLVQPLILCVTQIPIIFCLSTIWSFLFCVLIFIDLCRQWMNDSYEYWDDLRRKEYAALAGVTQLSVYCFSSTDPSIVRVSAIEFVDHF